MRRSKYGELAGALAGRSGQAHMGSVSQQWDGPQGRDSRNESPSLPVYHRSTTGRNQIRLQKSRDLQSLCLSFLSLF